MEARVAKLEATVDAIKSDVSDLKSTLSRVQTDVAEMKGEVRHLVSHKWLALYIAGLAALILRNEIAALLTTTP